MTRYESKHVANNAIIYYKNTIKILLCLTDVILSLILYFKHFGMVNFKLQFTSDQFEFYPFNILVKLSNYILPFHSTDNFRPTFFLSLTFSSIPHTTPTSSLLI